MTTVNNFETAQSTIKDINNYRTVVNYSFEKGDTKRALEVYKITEKLLRDVGFFCREFNARPTVCYSDGFINFITS